jgi:hypothetical protein
MEIRIIKEPITIEELKRIAQERYGDLVKAVVDLQQGIMAVGGEFHADEEVVLMEQEHSSREHTWGINLWPGKKGTAEFIQFDSMVNLKPSFGNRTRGVDDPVAREKIQHIVRSLIVL